MLGELAKTENQALRRIMDSIGDGILLTDQEGRLIYLNEAAANILHCSQDTAVGKTFAQVCPLVNLITLEVLPDPVEKAIKQGRVTGLTQNAGIIEGNGFWIYLSATCSPIWTNTNEIKGCSVILRDVTRLRRLESQLEAERKSLHVVFSAASVGMCALDTNGAIVTLNRAALDIFQITHDAAIGCQFGDAFRCAHSLEGGCGNGKLCPQCPVRKNITMAAENDSYSGSFTVQMQRKESTGLPTVWLKVFISQAWDSGQKQLVLSMVDISERRQHEMELEKARHQAEEASAARGQFLANMSHEIRTPINGMMGMIDLTLQTELTAEQRANLQSAKECSEDLLHLINDILDFSKLDNGKMEIENIRYDLRGIFDRVLPVHERVAKGKGLLFRKDYSPNLPKYIYGDPLRVRQVLHNLLTNALKFTSRGHVGFYVRRGDKNGVPILIFSVEDTGIGIKPEEQKKLFQAFSQVDGSTTRRFGGTGLGLMIVKKLVELMAGEISVESVPGKGSRFTFYLPYQEAECADEEKKEQTVFLKPHHVQEIDTVDVEDLLKYCAEKLGE